MKGWFAVDLDGVLARYEGWKGPAHIGDPVPVMLDRVKRWLAMGRDVRIFTARIGDLLMVAPADEITDKESDAAQAAHAIREWSLRHLGRVLPITCVKDSSMVALYDDRAVQIEANTGKVLGIDNWSPA